MATINLYLEPEDPVSGQDVKKFVDNVRGSTKTYTLAPKHLNADRVKSTFNIKKELISWAVRDFNLSGATKKLLAAKGDIQGRIDKLGSYDLFFTVSAEVSGEVRPFRIKGELELVSEEPVGEPEPCPVTYANRKVQSACEGDRNLKNKIESIALAGPTERGHGAVPYLKGAYHAHATNTHSVAWEWKNGTMHVVAWGKKNNQNKQQKRGGRGPNLKTMEYDWDEG